MKRILSVFALVTSSVAPCASDAQTVRPGARPDSGTLTRPRGAIDGVVSDTNLVPLRGAFISILGTKIRVGTGPNGRFRIVDVPTGQYVVIVRRSGYHPTSAVIEVPVTDTLRLAYTLTESHLLDTVVVTERRMSLRLAEFDARRRRGIGEFMSQEQIERHNSVYATELFRRFQSVNVAPSRTRSMPEYFALSRREGANPSLGACPMQVVLDQVPLPMPFNLDLLPPPRDLAGIEVYAGPSTTPLQFSGYNRGCGVILVWTKDGY